MRVPGFAVSHVEMAAASCSDVPLGSVEDSRVTQVAWPELEMEDEDERETLAWKMSTLLRIQQHAHEMAPPALAARPNPSPPAP